MSRLQLSLIALTFFCSCNLSSEKISNTTSTVGDITTTVSQSSVDDMKSSSVDPKAMAEKTTTTIAAKTDEVMVESDKMKASYDEMKKNETVNVNRESSENIAKYESSSTTVNANTQVSEKTEARASIPSEVSTSNSVQEQEVKTVEKEASTNVVVNQPKEVRTSVIEKKEEMSTPPVKEKAVSPKPVLVEGHDMWNKLLSTHVSSSGHVNYGAIKKNEAQLDAYLAWLESNAPSKSDKSQKAKAFWINAYNAYTIKLIVNNYPVSSITELHGGKPWDVSWIKLGGSTYSLNNIEHDIIRPIWKDARIHFAVNCAAKSCPPIANKAYTVGNMDALLESSTKKFINNASFNTISSSSMSLSKIFDWYKEDFGDLIGYINKYSSAKVGSGASISFQDYNWSLNGK